MDARPRRARDACRECGGAPAILVNPRIKVSTAEVFKRLNAAPYRPDEMPPSPLPGADFSSPEKAAASLKHGRNDLEPPAVAIEPAVERTLEAIRRQEGCLLARLSGSGPTCFGLFPTQEVAKMAAEAVGREHPGWWVCGGDAILMCLRKRREKERCQIRLIASWLQQDPLTLSLSPRGERDP